MRSIGLQQDRIWGQSGNKVQQVVKEFGVAALGSNREECMREVVQNGLDSRAVRTRTVDQDFVASREDLEYWAGKIT